MAVARRILRSLAPAGALVAIAACTHTPPPLVPRPVDLSVRPSPKPVDRSIGNATMLADGTIVMELRTSDDTGGSGHMTQKIKPGDMQYAQVLKQLGGLKPGQSKPINDYPVQ